MRRFWAKVDLDGPIPTHRPDLGPCWIWTAGTNGRYGVIRVEGKNVKAHRWAWEQENGPVPKGSELDHLCRVVLCVRPSHMDPVTHAENVKRGDRNGNQRKTHCPAGHAYDGPNTQVDRRGRRKCRRCHRETVARSRERNHAVTVSAVRLR